MAFTFVIVSYMYIQTDSGEFSFHFVIHWAHIRRATYPCLDFTKNDHNYYSHTGNINISISHNLNLIILSLQAK